MNVNSRDKIHSNTFCSTPYIVVQSVQFQTVSCNRAFYFTIYKPLLIKYRLYRSKESVNNLKSLNLQGFYRG